MTETGPGDDGTSTGRREWGDEDWWTGKGDVGKGTGGR